MLVLTRKVGESITIGNNIKVTIINIRGKQVRVGIQASADTSIHREEIFQKIKHENTSASKTTKQSLDKVQALITPSKKLETVKICRYIAKKNLN